MNFSASTQQPSLRIESTRAGSEHVSFSCRKAQASPAHGHIAKETYLIRPWIFGRTLWDKFPTLKLVYGNIFQIVAFGITGLPHAFGLFERNTLVNPTLINPFASNCIVVPWLSTFMFAFFGRISGRLFILLWWNCSRVPSSLHGRDVLVLWRKRWRYRHGSKGFQNLRLWETSLDRIGCEFDHVIVPNWIQQQFMETWNETTPKIKC